MSSTAKKYEQADVTKRATQLLLNQAALRPLARAVARELNKEGFKPPDPSPYFTADIVTQMLQECIPVPEESSVQVAEEAANDEAHDVVDQSG